MTEAGKRLLQFGNIQGVWPPEDAIAAIEAEAAAAHEATLRERGWMDEYEVETATAMNYGDGQAAERARGCWDTMTDDRGAAALVERLILLDDPATEDRWSAFGIWPRSQSRSTEERWSDFPNAEALAKAILGEHGVFLPEGLGAHDLTPFPPHGKFAEVRMVYCRRCGATQPVEAGDRPPFAPCRAALSPEPKP